VPSRPTRPSRRAFSIVAEHRAPASTRRARRRYPCTSVFTRYGKIGAAGQVTVKKLGTDADVRKLHDKLIGEKTGKGYAERGGKTKATSGHRGRVGDPSSPEYWRYSAVGE